MKVRSVVVRARKVRLFIREKIRIQKKFQVRQKISGEKNVSTKVFRVLRFTGNSQENHRKINR